MASANSDRRRIGSAGLWLVLTSAGCGSRIHVGAAAPTSDPALSPGVQLGLHATTVDIFGVSVRGLASPDMALLGTGIEVGFVPGMTEFPSKRSRKKKRRKKASPYYFSPSTALGVHAVQLDWSAEDLSFGAGSPYVQLGGNLCRSRRREERCVGLSFEGSHFVRFGADNQTWLGASVVFGTYNENVGY